MAQDLLDPSPVDFSVNEAGVKKLLSDVAGGAAVGGNWSGELTRTGGGFKADEQDVKITIGEEEKRQRQQKDVPIWVRESTVSGEPETEASVPSGPSMGMLEDNLDNAEDATTDEITDLLLRHERTNKDKSVVIPGNDTDSDDKSDDSDVENTGDGVDRDAALLAATFTTNTVEDDDDDNVEVMDDDSDENDDIPTINVGGEEYDITDVTPDVIAKMSAEEMEKYNQLYQEFYKDMYD